MEKIRSFDEYKDIYQQSITDPSRFWAAVADDFHWQKKWDKVLEGDFNSEHIKWYDGGICNLSENCLDRHLTTRGDQTAIIWEPNDPNEEFKTLTYSQLHEQVSRFANVLKSLGIKKGDRVCIYLPMILEGAVAMLACARIGAIHSVVFAGFSAQSIIDRVNDSGCSLIITADAVFRGDKKIELKKIVDDALDKTPTIKHCIVFNHRQSAVNMKDGRDLWWGHLMNAASADCQPEAVGAEDPLFILSTSGSTG